MPISSSLVVNRLVRLRERRSLVALLLVVGLLALPGTAVRAQQSPVEEAAQEIIRAQERADRSAVAWADAQSQLDELQVQQEQLAQETAALESQLGGLRSGVENLALQRFMSGDAGGASIFSGVEGPTEQVEADVLTRVAANTTTSSIDEFEAAQADLEKKQAELQRKQEETEQAAATLESMRVQALEDVEAYTKLREERIKDEQIRRALEAQEAQRKAQEAAEREAAEAAARAAAELQAQVQAQQAQQAPRATPQSSPSRSTGGSGASGSSGSSGSGGGSAPAPAPAPAPVVVDGIACPLAGPSAFGDTYGASRSGGRSHQGVDMIAPRGTPIVAVVGGSVQFKQNRLGGNAVWLAGDNGNKYYYAHLDSFEGSSRGVSQGEVIGYVGDTGNARGTPHLHFEIHPGGGGAINPTPTVRNAC